MERTLLHAMRYDGSVGRPVLVGGVGPAMKTLGDFDTCLGLASLADAHMTLIEAEVYADGFIFCRDGGGVLLM